MTEKWEGFVNEILDGVVSIIKDAMPAIPLEAVMRGEKYRGFVNSTAFVLLGSRVRVSHESGRNNVTEYAVPVRVIVAYRSLGVSADQEVITRLERILDVLEAASPPGRAQRHDVESPADIIPVFDAADGAYATVGSIDLIFYADIERAR